MGADIVVHSTTKNISGNSTALGGIAVFRAVDTQSDKLLNEKYADLHKFIKKMGPKAFMPIFKKRAIRDMGMTANAFGSFLTMVGLETLPLRIERINQNVEKIAAILDEKLPEGVTVNHPSLPSNPDYERYLSDFPKGCGPMMSLNCVTKERAFALLNNLKIVIQTANIGDNRSLALHMTSTIFSDFDENARQFLGVHEGLIRVSIGLEDPQAVAQDFIQAANAI
jgi:O-acetylhomoserine (thiol)-lyase